MFQSLLNSMLYKRSIVFEIFLYKLKIRKSIHFMDLSIRRCLPLNFPTNPYYLLSSIAEYKFRSLLLNAISEIKFVFSVGLYFPNIVKPFEFLLVQSIG